MISRRVWVGQGTEACKAVHYTATVTWNIMCPLALQTISGRRSRIAIPIRSQAWWVALLRSRHSVIAQFGIPTCNLSREMSGCHLEGGNQVCIQIQPCPDPVEIGVSPAPLCRLSFRNHAFINRSGKVQAVSVDSAGEVLTLTSVPMRRGVVNTTKTPRSTDDRLFTPNVLPLAPSCVRRFS